MQYLCKHNFYLTQLIYWYEIETHYKLDHTFLKRNQTPNLFIKPHCKFNHTSNIAIKINSYEARSDYINLKEVLCWETIYQKKLTKIKTTINLTINERRK